MMSSKEDAEAVLAVIKSICANPRPENLERARHMARWDEVVLASKQHGYDEEAVDEAVNALIDAGKIYEPTLGVLKLV